MAARRGLLDLSIDDDDVDTSRRTTIGDSPVVSFTKNAPGTDTSNWQRMESLSDIQDGGRDRYPSEDSPLLGESSSSVPTFAEESGFVFVDSKDDELTAAAAAASTNAGGHYEDFHTIDWVRDRTRDSHRHKRLKRNKRESWKGWWHQINDAWSGWIVVSLVGVAAGLAAGVIDIGADWMGDLKSGVCWSEFWLNRAACCFLSNETTYDVEHCDEWRTWSDVFGVASRNGAAVYAVNYFFYLLIAIVFGFVSVVLVRFFAPYASGSGIPEVKII